MGDSPNKTVKEEYEDCMAMVERSAIKLCERLCEESAGYDAPDPTNLKITCLAVAERVWSQVYARQTAPQVIPIHSIVASMFNKAAESPPKES